MPAVVEGLARRLAVVATAALRKVVAVDGVATAALCKAAEVGCSQEEQVMRESAAAAAVHQAKAVARTLHFPTGMEVLVEAQAAALAVTTTIPRSSLSSQGVVSVMVPAISTWQTSGFRAVAVAVVILEAGAAHKAAVAAAD